MTELIPCQMNEACAGIVLDLSHKWQKHRRFYKHATPASFWARNLPATMEKLDCSPETTRDFFAAKMCEFGAILESAANLVDTISHKFLKQRRVLKKNAASRDFFWNRHGNQIMMDYGKATNTLIEVTMDTVKLGEAGESLGIDAGEPLKNVMTISISPDEYECLADLIELGIVKEITVVHETED